MAEEDATAGATQRTRRSYHHGDLRNALTEAAVELARTGGPDAVVLREVARETGVSSAAAYRHFGSYQDLVHEVKHTCLGILAVRMHEDLAAQEPLADLGDDAVRRLYTVGRTYVRFALEEPGLFRTIFRGMLDMEPGSAPEYSDGELEVRDDAAFMLLVEALDDLVTAGRMDPARRAMSDLALWAAVHGLSMILIDTPMAELPDEAKGEAVERLLDVTIGGLFV